MSRDIDDEQEGIPEKYLPDPELLEDDEVELIPPNQEEAFYGLASEDNDPFLEHVLHEYVMAEPNGLNINSWLRGQFPHITLNSTVTEPRIAAEEMERHKEVLDDFIAASELSDSMVVYKGIRRDHNRYLQYAEVHFPDYISTSPDLSVAEEFACWDYSADENEPCVLLVIHLEPGQYAFDVYINLRESEYLLPHDWWLIIDEREEVEPHKHKLTCRVRPA